MALAALSVFLALFFPFIITAPAAAAATVAAIYAARRHAHTRLALASAFVSAAVLAQCVFLAANAY